MATAATASDGKIRIGKILRVGLRTTFRNIVPFGTLALLLTSPILVLSPNFLGVVDVRSTGTIDLSPEEAAGFLASALLLMLASWFLGSVLFAAIIYGTYEDLRGQRPSMVNCLRVGFVRAVPMVVVAILAWLSTVPFLLVLVIPGAVVALMLSASIPVSVVERPGIVASLKRSYVLTKGNKWRLLGLFVVSMLILFVVAIPFVTAVGFAVFSGMFENVPGSAMSILSWVLQAFSALVFATFLSVTYYALRIAKDELDVSNPTPVFD